MKERPIIFSGPMVRALLDGTKTQTRRVINPQPDNALTLLTVRVGDRNPFITAMKDGFYSIRCPYGQPGDRLWVREAWTIRDEHPDMRRKPAPGDAIAYRATDGRAGMYHGPRNVVVRWRPSTHMPRFASRLTLEITGIRVERLNEISEADSWAEGVRAADYNSGRVGYKALWNSINGPGSWKLNPWVWVVGFRKMEGGEI